MTPDYYQGLRVNLATVACMVDGELAELGLVDSATLKHIVPLAAAGVSSAYSALETAISAEVWLRSVNAAPEVRWDDTQLIPEAV